MTTRISACVRAPPSSTACKQGKKKKICEMKNDRYYPLGWIKKKKKKIWMTEVFDEKSFAVHLADWEDKHELALLHRFLNLYVMTERCGQIPPLLAGLGLHFWRDCERGWPSDCGRVSLRGLVREQLLRINIAGLWKKCPALDPYAPHDRSRAPAEEVCFETQQNGWRV